jgi:1,2-phenylacetyl-CoA epoxidase catalytic subunit
MNSDLLFDRSYINGAWTNHGLGSFEVINPANGKVLATVLDGGKEIVEQATLTLPTTEWAVRGGRDGYHTENLGHLLTEMQFVYRSFPGAKW